MGFLLRGFPSKNPGASKYSERFWFTFTRSQLLPCMLGSPPGTPQPVDFAENQRIPPHCWAFRKGSKLEQAGEIQIRSSALANFTAESSTCSTPPPRTARTKCKTASPPAIHTSPSSRNDGATGAIRKIRRPVPVTLARELEPALLQNHRHRLHHETRRPRSPARTADESAPR